MADPAKIKKSRAQEDRGAKLHGGTRNAGSGNTPWRKNDVRVEEEFLIEYKRTDKKTLTIAVSALEELRTNALLEGRTPLLGIELGGRDWTLIETAEFERRRRERGLDSGEVRQSGGSRPDVPRGRARAQETAHGRQGSLSRARRARSLPHPGDVS